LNIFVLYLSLMQQTTVPIGTTGIPNTTIKGTTISLKSSSSPTGLDISYIALKYTIVHQRGEDPRHIVDRNIFLTAFPNRFKFFPNFNYLPILRLFEGFCCSTVFSYSCILSSSINRPTSSRVSLETPLHFSSNSLNYSCVSISLAISALTFSSFGVILQVFFPSEGASSLHNLIYSKKSSRFLTLSLEFWICFRNIAYYPSQAKPALIFSSVKVSAENVLLTKSNAMHRLTIWTFINDIIFNNSIFVFWYLNLFLFYKSFFKCNIHLFIIH